MVPHWVRGEETAEITVARRGGCWSPPSAAASPRRPRASRRRSWRPTASRGSGRWTPTRVTGRIVLFNRAMVAGSANGGLRADRRPAHRGARRRPRGWGRWRRSCARWARSPRGSCTPVPCHVRGRASRGFPAAAITAEDADLIARLSPRAARPPTCGSASAAAPCPTRSRTTWWPTSGAASGPDEVVLIGAHLDSWDLGTGADDDGAGVAMVMEALRSCSRRWACVPRRTVRGVLLHERGERPARRARPTRPTTRRSCRGTWPPSRPTAAGSAHRASTPTWTRQAWSGSRALVRRAAPAGRRRRIRAGGGGADIAPLAAGARAPAGPAPRHHALLRLAPLARGHPRQGGPAGARARARRRWRRWRTCSPRCRETLPRPGRPPRRRPRGAERRPARGQPRGWTRSAPAIAPRRRQGLHPRRPAAAGLPGAGRLRGPARLPRRRRAGPRACASLGGPFAVRSSAASEDGADASFAGQYRTVLDVTGADAVRAAVDRCRAATGRRAATRRRWGRSPATRSPCSSSGSSSPRPRA